MTVKTIDVETLRQMLEDPDVPEEALRPYVLEDEENSDAFDPAFRPNPETVTGVSATEAAALLGIFNGRSRRRRQKKYQKKIDDGWDGIKIVSEGDSWFQYPIRLDDVIDQLFDRYAIWSLGGAGHLLKDMVEKNEVLTAVREKRPDVVLVSGSGNDMVGKGRLAGMVYPGEGRPPEEALNDRFSNFLTEMEGLFVQLINSLEAEFPTLPILIHGYDLAIPASGKWLGRPLESVGIETPEYQASVVEVMINRLNGMQEQLANRFPGRVFHVDCRNAVQGDWHDELHPTDSGYSRVASRFDVVIQTATQ